MLSILIPIYNWDITPLINALTTEANAIGVEYEIICMDDCSQQYKEKNRQIAHIPRCKYTELPENIGRGKIRNRLAQEAKFSYMLFLDCDLMPATAPFLGLYIQHLSPQRVIAGSVLYPDGKVEREERLRYLFGKKRESVPAATRNRRPYHGFNTFNFLVSKETIDKVKFDEYIRGYGHEDTLFGIELQQRGIEVLHIDTPATHAEIDHTHQFIDKTESSIRNLFTIEERIGNDLFAQHFALPRLFKKIKPLSPLIALFHFLFGWVIKKALMGPLPSLFLLDIYKVGYYNSILTNLRPKKEH